MVKKKYFLSLEDFQEFFSDRRKSFHYFAENDDDSIAIQLPGTMIFSEEDYDPTLGLLPVHLKSCHLYRNRNQSNIDDDPMNQAILSIYNRPILGYIHQLNNGDYDFAGHEMFVNDDGDVEYEEIAVGTIPESGKAKLVYDEENDKTYLEVDGYIYEEYTRAAEILRRKKECKVSVELCLLEFSYDAKEKCLNIDKFYFSGITILGVTRDGKETPIKEGMAGSNIKLKDLKKSNNSIIPDINQQHNEKLIELLEQLSFKIDNLTNSTINNQSTEEGGKLVTKFEELLAKYNKSVEEITFDYENMSDEELEAKFAEVFEDDTNGEGEENPEPASDGDGGSEDFNKDDDKDDSDNDDPEDDDPENPEEPVADPEDDDDDEHFEEASVAETETPVEVKYEKYAIHMSDGTVKEFALSLDEITNALYMLVNETYGEADNAYYCVYVYEDGSLVMEDWWNNKAYRQSYNREGDTFSLSGDRIPVTQIWVTEDEMNAFNEMKANYSSICSELEAYKDAEAYADKMTVFEDEAYANYLETDEFKSLMNKDFMKKFTRDELIEKADAALGKLVKTLKTFTYKEESKETKKSPMFAFSKTDKDASFLDKLLKQN